VDLFIDTINESLILERLSDYWKTTADTANDDQTTLAESDTRTNFVEFET
jgi:hypothetical protein